MIKIKVTESTLRLGAGALVALSAAQAAARAHALRKEGDSFRTTQPVEFKVGEELAVGNLDDLPKSMRPVVVGVERPLPGEVQAKPKKSGRRAA